LVAFVAMLPRLWSAQFGLLDDGQTLRMAMATSSDWTNSYTMFRDAGRFFPAYILFLWAVHSIVGPRPLLFFVANYVVLCGITAGLIWLVRARGGTTLQAAAAGLFFVFSGPAVESFYTLSKAEPPQLLWITVSLLLLTLSSRAATSLRKAGVFLAMTAVLLVANLAKETTVVLIPVSLGWLVVGWLAARLGKGGTNLAERKRYFFASAIAWSTFVLLRLFLGRLTFTKGSYTEHYGAIPATLASSVTDLVVLLGRDFTYLVPLAVWLMVVSVERGGRQGLLLADTVIWMVGWVAVFLPWGRVFEYYLLPFTFGLAAFSGIALGRVLGAISGESGGFRRRAATVCLALFLLIWLLNLSNRVTDAAVQLAVDAANDDMIRFAATLPAYSILLVDIPGANEYTYEIGVHLSDVHHRGDIVVSSIDEVAVVGELILIGKTHYIVVPRVRRHAWPAVRIAVYEGGGIYGHRALGPAAEQGAEVVYRTRRRVQLLSFGLQQFACKLIASEQSRGLYCGHEQRLMDTRMFRYGWEIYKVSGNESRRKG
jgi:hypothetical protein